MSLYALKWCVSNTSVSLNPELDPSLLGREGGEGQSWHGHPWDSSTPASCSHCAMLGMGEAAEAGQTGEEGCYVGSRRVISSKRNSDFFEK